ncbi:hypothetical protein XENOCAPTIV_009336 [Xenoophorus captivus]|uniref:ADAM10 cysteine-rich domain-containing protein n=1 Tax=Xenoophorus captivus TaxID=1517983 RepID=A0ABV0R3J2_9TELE
MAHTKLLCVLQTVYMIPVLQHDSGSECTPGESVDRNKKELGNYVMYARATSGDKINNNKFSICSIRNISAVLLKKRDSCFVGKLPLINKVEKLCVRFCFNQVCISTQMNPSTCSSTGSERWAKHFEGQVKTLQPGSPCNDFKGYCDVFTRCRLVDADGPLARLKKAIFNPELYENIADWIMVSVLLQAYIVYRKCIQQPSVGANIEKARPMLSAVQAHWWAVLLMGIALIMLMAGFIKICSVHTPSSNPRLPEPKPLPGTI